MYEDLTHECLYQNPLSESADLKDFRVEGDAGFSFPQGRWRLQGTRDPGEGQAANVVVWCPQDFPDHTLMTWSYRPLQDPGLSILFFSAQGVNGEDIFDPALAPRSGPYKQYHSGDINCLHVSYFRRKHSDERAFTTCNLRKSRGFHLVAQGADPLPSLEDMKASYEISVLKSGRHVRFAIDDIECFRWQDPEGKLGPALGGGKIGFRQMTPLVAEYWDLKVYSLKEEAR